MQVDARDVVPASRYVPLTLYILTLGKWSKLPGVSGYCKQASDSVPCGACYSVCPRVGNQLQETLGSYTRLITAKAAYDIPRKQSGGAVTAIVANALDEGLIDAVVTVTEDPWTLRPSSVVITKSDILIQQAGSRYSWWVPLLAALKNAVIERKFRRIAVIGVPCAIQAIARILYQRQRPSETLWESN